MAPLLKDIPPARLFEEVCKLFLTGHGSRSMEALQRFGLSSILFPSLKKGNGPGKVLMGPLLKKALENTDERVRDSKPVTPAFLFAALLWQPVRDRSRALVAGPFASPGGQGRERIQRNDAGLRGGHLCSGWQHGHTPAVQRGDQANLDHATPLCENQGQALAADSP